MVKPTLGISNATKAKPDKTQPSELDLARTTRLKQALMAAGKTNPPPKTAVWAKWMRLAAKTIPAERLDRALDWVIANTNRLGKDGVPPIYSAESFYKLFMWLEERVQKDQKANPVVAETPTGKAVTKWLLRLHWPNGTAAQLPAQVELSLLAYADFAKRLRDWRQAYKPGADGKRQQLFRFAERVQSHLRTPEDFVNHWFKGVWDWAHKTKQLKNLSKWGFDPRHKNFDELGAGWATAYGDSRLWGILMAEVMK